MEKAIVAISEGEKDLALQSSIFRLLQEQPFYGTLLQSLNIKYSNLIPTAAITYDAKNCLFQILLNAQFFCRMPVESRAAVLHHEILHFTNRHLFRLPFMGAKEEDRHIYNLAGDMAINQYIAHLPPGGVDVKEWKLNNGEAFPLFRSMEEYYGLIKDNQKNNKKARGETMDQHIWEELDDEQKQKMLEIAKNVVVRTIEKTSNTFSNLPEGVQDLLKDIERMMSVLDYKGILKRAIKKTSSAQDRESSWKRPNKRYSCYAPGTKLGTLPKLHMYVDTSGSISHTELNEFLGIMDNFLRVGSKECQLSLWHENIYFSKKYKLKSNVAKDNLQSGGTIVTNVLNDIKKRGPDLSIILTDGYFEQCAVKPSSEIIWIISKGGNASHPMKHVGKTILLDKLR